MKKHPVNNTPTVLIVEDDNSTRQLYRVLLENAGFTVIEANSYEQAIVSLNHSIGIALLDVVLAEQSGLDVLKYIRENYPLCPAIMISAYADKDNAITALHEGAVAYLEKPVDHFELVHTVQHWFDYNRMKKNTLRLQDYETAHQILLENTERLSGILGSTIEAIISINETQTITLFNRGAEEIFGYRQSEVLGKPLTILIPKQHQPSHEEKVATFGNSSKQSHHMNDRGEIRGIRKNGEIFPAEASISQIELNGKKIMTAVLRDISERKRSEKILEDSFIETIYTLTRAAEYRDDETGAHVKRISYFSKTLAKEIGMAPDFCTQIFYASAMHDIGKIGIPDHILLKKGDLSEEEWKIMRTHPTIGGGILAGASSPYLKMGANIALGHHERWDGGGYPGGLKGEAIPIEARITQLADTYDALRSERPYKKAFDHEKAMNAILKGDGRTHPGHFDPVLLEAFKRCANELADIFTQRNNVFNIEG